MSQTRSHLSDEEDLSKLYNDVLAGFASEGDGTEPLTSSFGHGGSIGTPGEANISSIYEYYTADPPRNYLSSRPASNGVQTHASGMSTCQQESTAPFTQLSTVVDFNPPAPGPGRPGALPPSPRPSGQRVPRPLPKPPSGPNSPTLAVPGPSTRIVESHSYYPEEKRTHVSSPSVDKSWSHYPADGRMDATHPPQRAISYSPLSQSHGSDSMSNLSRHATTPSDTFYGDPSEYGSGRNYRPSGAALPTPPSASNGHHTIINGPQHYDTPPVHSSPGIQLSGQPSHVNFRNENGEYRSSDMSVSSELYGSSESASQPVKSISRSALERVGGFENGFDRQSSSGSSYDREDTVMAPSTPSTSIQRGGSLSSSIYAPASPSLPQELHSRPPVTVSSYAPDAGYNGESSRHAESSRTARHHEEMQRTIASIKGPLELHEDDDDFEDIDEDPDRFVILALLSHLAVRLRDKVPRGTHVKGSIPYDHAFTGKDIVVRSNSETARNLAESILIVYYPISNSEGTPCQSRNFHKRSTHGFGGRSQPSEPVVLL